MPAALLSTAAAIGLVAGVLTVAERETERLVIDFRSDAYQQNITAKLEPVVELIHRLDRLEDAIAPEATPKPADATPSRPNPPTPALIKQSGNGVLGWLPVPGPPAGRGGRHALAGGSADRVHAGPAGDHRDRLLGLARRRQLATRSAALDDAAHRVGRFPAAPGRDERGDGSDRGRRFDPHRGSLRRPVGLLTAALRFLPYVGIWLAALFPIVLALAAFPGWGPAVLVVVLYAGFDLVMTNVVEPLLLGHGTGVSSLAVPAPRCSRRSSGVRSACSWPCR